MTPLVQRWAGEIHLKKPDRRADKSHDHSKGKQMAAQTWAITAQKGGVSKTTTSVNLAAALATLGQRVLLCDLDPQSNATVHLGIDPINRAGRSMYELITKKISVREAIFVSARANLDL